MIRRLPFAAALVYATRGTSAVSKQSQRLRDRIKRGDQGLLDQIALYIRSLVDAGTFPDFFGPDVTLMPVPGHAPLAPGAVSVTARVATALHRQGLGAEIAPLLERAAPVKKSAFAAPKERPRMSDHLDSFVMNPALSSPRQILLVDDFVTRGATLLGAASRVSEVYPKLDIRGFALVRSITDGEIERIREPCIGAIEIDVHGETRRRP